MNTTKQQTGEGNAPRVTTFKEQHLTLGQTWEALAEVTAQRDELLAALKEAKSDLCAIVADAESGEFEVDGSFAIERAESAIAKVEGNR